jgi:thiamine-monophosphate kinase
MDNREYKDLKSVLGTRSKNSKQLNKLFESDCEILKLGPKRFLATSIDSISDEIELGLYQNIETWAWLTVMSSVSDLAASGASPLGLTVSTQWKYDSDPEMQKKFFAEVIKACKISGVPFLGGDSGFTSSHVFTSSIIGESKTKPLMRTGIKAGDLLVLAHNKNVGIGPALAFRFLLKAPEDVLPERLFRPVPSLKLSQQISLYASAAIDTSDGIASSVSILCELNNLGAELYWNDSINSNVAQAALVKLKLSPVFLWLGDHGDFQTLFAINEKNFAKIKNKKNLTVIGKMTKKKDTVLHYKDKIFDLPLNKITTARRDLDSYSALVKEMQAILAPYELI